MKKLCALILALVTIISLAGCSSKKVTTNPDNDVQMNAHAPTNAVEEKSEPQEPEEAYTLDFDESKKINAFDLSVALNTDSHTLNVVQELNYVNNTGTQLSEIYFNLIPKAFESDGGGLEIQRISITDTDCQMQQIDGTVYTLTLPSPLENGARLDIHMEYSVAVPDIKNRFGYVENTYNLGNFIATPAVYTNSGWSVEPYVDIGDAFYTDIADYNVSITVPEGYTVAASGEEVSPGQYRAKHVRGFAFCASDSYKVISDECQGVAISFYYQGELDKTAQRGVDNAKKSLELYNKTFGVYPYKTLSIVMNSLTGGVNGMEYPTLVMVDPEVPLEEYTDIDLSNEATVNSVMYYYDMALCHEIAHQWFYGIVGNDEVKEAWLDEGMCRYSEYLFQMEYIREMDEDWGAYWKKDSLEFEYTFVTGDGKDPKEIFAEDDTYLGRDLYYWWDNDPMGYGTIYEKGASLIYAMEKRMSADDFGKALKDYVQEFAYGFVTGDDFRDFWNERYDFTDLFDIYFK